MKEVKYDTNKWKAIRFHELEELILLVSILPKAIISIHTYPPS